MSKEKKDHFEGVIIRHNRLIRRHWVEPVWIDENDLDKGVVSEGYYNETDITEELPTYLGYHCRIDSGTTLREFFQLIENHKDIFGIIQKRNWFTEYLEFGLSAPPTKKENNPVNDHYEIDYLEIYAQLDHDIDQLCTEDVYLEMNSTSGKLWKELIYSKGDRTGEETNLIFGFHAQSVPFTEEFIKNSSERCWKLKDVGRRINIGFFGCDLQDLMDFELRLSNVLTVTNSFHFTHKYASKDWKNFSYYNLFDIIDTIFYELSFSGPPEKSKLKKEEILRSYEEAEKEIEENKKLN